MSGNSIREIAENAQPINPAPGAAAPIVVAKDDKKPKKKADKKVEAEGKQPLSAVLPDECPVVPLGVNGSTYYYIDPCKQLQELEATDHSRLGLLSLFNKESQYLWNTWPRVNENGAVTGWRPEIAAEALIGACGRLGLIDVKDRVRGPGGWVDDDGNLVFHCGDKIFQVGAEGASAFEPGRIGRHIYHAAPPTPRPAPGPERASSKPAAEFYELLAGWKWRQPDRDPHLLLGWIAAAMFGGALKWRPIIWITGDKATGKSTLHEAINGILGNGGSIHATDPTAAGLWQTVKRASLPITLDELEAESDNRKAHNIIKLARHAASGGQTLRGGSDHKSATFTARNCFLFSSILIPPLLGQDVSRMAILELDRLDATSKAPHLEPKKLAEIGAVFRKRLIDQWPRYAETLAAYRETLQSVGHGGRSSDQFGTLLACADLLLYDAAPDSDTLKGWGDKLRWLGLSEAENDLSDSERCVSHMLSSICPVYKDGKQRTIGSWIEQAADRFTSADLSEADKVLGAMGLRVERGRLPTDPKHILVANMHQGLAAVFRDTIWASAPGTSGVWVQSMRRIQGATASKSSTNFGGAPSRYTRILLDHVLPEEQKVSAS
ncbi:MAG: hypothetical protein JNM12_10030 [Alphaproteobacteria bacterium]|nr:hypothetical protein [Alphaproteobacteria bacterium]